MPFRTRTGLLLAALLLFGRAAAAQQEGGPFRFEHHYITSDLPGDNDWGYGAPAVADFDRDGDLDFALGVRGDSLYWFEYRAADDWARHAVGPLPLRTLGAATLDVDGDGWMDLVVGGAWYRNPARPRQAPFTRYVYDPRIETEIHDVVAADLDGDGRRDVAVLGDKEGAFWYRVPAHPTRGAPWERTEITRDVHDDRDDIHSGFFPNGVADLDADGDADVVLPDRWLENRSGGAAWTAHPLPAAKVGPWGLSARSWIVDLDADGDADIVLTDSDGTDSRVRWLESDGAPTPRFTAHLLPPSAAGTRGSFHALAVADFDLDGDLDLFTVEQEDDKLLPQGANPRWYIWERLDGPGVRFAERVILDARLGGHDAFAVDVDGDGDVDLVSKVWNVWPGNANGGREHVDFLENQAR